MTSFLNAPNFLQSSQSPQDQNCAEGSSTNEASLAESDSAKNPSLQVTSHLIRPGLAKRQTRQTRKIWAYKEKCGKRVLQSTLWRHKGFKNIKAQCLKKFCLENITVPAAYEIRPCIWCNKCVKAREAPFLSVGHLNNATLGHIVQQTRWAEYIFRSIGHLPKFGKFAQAIFCVI